MLSRVTEYAFALGIVILAGLVRAFLGPFLPEGLPYITFFPAVFLAAYFWGVGPGIVSVLLSLLIGGYWFYPPDHNPSGLFSASLLFLIVGSIIVWLVGSLQAAHQRSRAHEAQLNLINGELRHRIKNLFAIADSICQQTVLAGGNPSDISRDISGRLSAISSAQEFLGVDAEQGGELLSIVHRVVTPLSPSSSALRAQGPLITLRRDQTTATALILHELATNALKHGAWSTGTGYVEITWIYSGDVLTLKWKERDGPAVAGSASEGIGTKLIKNSLPDGHVEHVLEIDGVRCQVLMRV